MKLKYTGKNALAVSIGDFSQNFEPGTVYDVPEAVGTWLLDRGFEQDETAPAPISVAVQKKTTARREQPRKLTDAATRTSSAALNAVSEKKLAGFDQTETVPAAANTEILEDK